MMLKRTISCVDLGLQAIPGPSKVARLEGARDVKLKLQRSLTPPQLNLPPPPKSYIPPASSKPLFPIPGSSKRSACASSRSPLQDISHVEVARHNMAEATNGRGPSFRPPPRAILGPMPRLRRHSSPLAPPSARFTRQLSAFQPPPGVRLGHERSDAWLRKAVLRRFGADKDFKYWSLRQRGIGVL